MELIPPKRTKNRNDIEKDKIAIALVNEKGYFSSMYEINYLSIQRNHYRKAYSTVTICDGCNRPSSIFIHYRMENKERCPLCFQIGYDFKSAQEKHIVLEKILADHCEFQVLKHTFRKTELDKFDRKSRFRNEHRLLLYSFHRDR